MKTVIASIFALAVSLPAFAQQPQVPTPTAPPVAAASASDQITVESSYEEDRLVALAKQTTETQKIINDLFQQARTTLDEKNKPILEEIKQKSAKYQAKIDAETKDLKAKLDDNTRQAQADFQNRLATLQSQITPPQTIKELSDTVKHNQHLPDDAYFDQSRGVWIKAKSTTPPAPAAPQKK